MRKTAALALAGMILVAAGVGAYAGPPAPQAVPNPYPGGSPFPPGQEPSLTHTVKVFWTTADGMETEIRIEAEGQRPTQFTAWTVTQAEKEVVGSSVGPECGYHILMCDKKRDTGPGVQEIVVHGSGYVEVRVFGFEAADFRASPVVKAAYSRDGVQVGETSAEAHPVPDKLKAAAAQEQALRIEGLISRLAISDEPAAPVPVPTPDVDTPASDARVIAFQAAAELKKYAKAAFPYLLRHLGDRRQSVAFRRVLTSDVGGACFSTIQDQVFPLPQDYQGSFYRRGADGQLHERPLFLAPALFDRESVASWLSERENSTLKQIQAEALRWLIAQEEQIGFENESDKERYLYPLQRQAERLQESAAGGRRASPAVEGQPLRAD